MRGIQRCLLLGRSPQWGTNEPALQKCLGSDYSQMGDDGLFVSVKPSAV